MYEQRRVEILCREEILNYTIMWNLKENEFFCENVTLFSPYYGDGGSQLV